MARFEDAIGVILAHEGGLVDDPRDPGGLTNHGITWATFQRLRGTSATPSELRSLSEDGAADLYRIAYWPSVYMLIEDQSVATKIFDCAVNMGAHQAHVLLQRACSSCGFRLAEDGTIGPHTLAAVNSIDGENLVSSLCSQQAAFYRELVAEKPELAWALSGWLTRAKWPYTAQRSPA